MLQHTKTASAFFSVFSVSLSTLLHFATFQLQRTKVLLILPSPFVTGIKMILVVITEVGKPTTQTTLRSIGRARVLGMPSATVTRCPSSPLRRGYVGALRHPPVRLPRWSPGGSGLRKHGTFLSKWIVL